MCLMLRNDGIRLAPNQSATKLAMLLDLADPDRSHDLCFGTVDTWVAWVLSGGELHVTDHTNAGVTGLVTHDGLTFDADLCEKLPRPAVGAAADRRLDGSARPRLRPRGRSSDRRRGRGPAGVPRRPGLPSPRKGEGNLRDGRHARLLCRFRPSGVRRAGYAGLLPDHRME